MECGGEVALVHNMTIACVCLPVVESFLSCDLNLSPASVMWLSLVQEQLEDQVLHFWNCIYSASVIMSME